MKLIDTSLPWHDLLGALRRARLARGAGTRQIVVYQQQAASVLVAFGGGTVTHGWFDSSLMTGSRFSLIFKQLIMLATHLKQFVDFGIKAPSSKKTCKSV